MNPKIVGARVLQSAAAVALLLLGQMPDAHSQRTRLPNAATAPKRHVIPYPTHSIENEVFYFVMPDRFEDGNPSNNEGDKTDRWSSGGYDPTNKSMYHGGDIVGLQKRLDYLKGMGITAIWMTPILKNKAIQGDSAGYHGYWTLDFTRLDPHLGTNDEMKALIRAAHARGIKVYFDIIVNHTADVIAYKECHNADGSFRAGLSGCEYKSRAQLAAGNTYTPFVPAGQERIKVPAWLNDPKYYHNQGDSTWSGENSVYGDFVGLDDIDTDNPEVVNGMIDIFKKLVSDWKPDGFRIDTVKHVDTGFWQAFSPAVIAHARNVVGIKHFTMFGEVYSGDPRLLSFYTTTGRLPSVLDFGFQAAAASVVAGNGPAGTLSSFFAFDDLYNDADSSANQLLTFLGNHDMGRFGKFLKDGGTKGDAELVARYRLANALMFTSRGAPVVYYGDEQGFTGDDGDKDAREDMFPSRVASYNDNVLIGTKATTADSNFDTAHPLYRSIAELAKLKHTHPELRSGIQMARTNSDTSGKVLTFSRVDLKRGSELLLAFNFSPSDTKTVTLPAAAATYQSVHGGGAPVVTAGSLSVTVPAMSFVALKANAVTPSPVATPKLTGVQDGSTVADTVELTVEVPGLATLALPQYQAMFEASIDGKPYKTLAVDNNAPYRLHWDTSALANGSAVKLRATLNNLTDTPRSAELAFTVDARSPVVNLHYENTGKLPTALVYASDCSVSVADDADANDGEFTTRFDWGKAASRSLVFARLAGAAGQPTVVEKPVAISRDTVMKLARADAAGTLAVDLHVNSNGAVSNQPNATGGARERLTVDAGNQPPLPSDVNVRGGLNGWGTTPMAYIGQGTYRVSTFVKEGDVEFKFADKTWGAFNVGQPFGDTGLTGGPNPGNLLLRAEKSMMFDFTLVVAKDAAGKQYLLHAIRADPRAATPAPDGATSGTAMLGSAPFGDTAVFVRGELPGDVALTHVGNGIYEALVVLDPGNKSWGDDGLTALKIGDADWARVNLGAAGDAALVPGTPKPLQPGSNTNLTLAAPLGVYKVSVNAADAKAPTLTLSPLARDFLVVHFGKPDADYAGWGLHAWGSIADGHAPDWKKPIPLTGKTAFGRYAVVPMKEASKLGFIVHKGDTKNTPADLFFTPTAKREIWIVGGDANIYESLADAERALAARAK